MAKKTLTRRAFLAASGAGTSLNILRFGTLYGEEPKALDKLSVAFIGMGGQIQGHVANILNQGQHVAAFCDVDKRQIDNSKKRHGNKVNKVKEYEDYRELIEKEKS